MPDLTHTRGELILSLDQLDRWTNAGRPVFLFADEGALPTAADTVRGLSLRALAQNILLGHVSEAIPVRVALLRNERAR